MNILIIFDSLHGNTEKIARAIAKGFRKSDTTKIIHVDSMTLSDFKKVHLLIVGSPTHGGRPKPALLAFLNSIPDNALKGMYCATFDTRFLERKQALPLRLLMKAIGYAAPKIGEALAHKGCKNLLQPEGFIVKDKTGPLEKGELARATRWSQKLINAQTQQI